MSSNVVVVATFEAAEGNADKVEQVLRAAVEAVHAEPGCLRYALHRDAGSPETFVLIKNWASPEAIEAHRTAPALADLVAGLDGLLAEPLRIQRLTPIPGGDPERGRV